MIQHTCTNCGNIFTGHFCNECGQKLNHRYTVAHVLHEFVHVFTHADKGIFAFSKQILLRPGKVALDFVEGRRKRHFNLFQFLLLVVGLGTFIAVKSGAIKRIVSESATQQAPGLPRPVAEVQASVLGLLQEYFNIYQFLTIPLVAFFSWLFFRKQRFNYAEHIVLHCAVLSASNLIGVATFLIYWWLKLGADSMTLISGALLLFYYSISFKQFFDKISWLKAALMALATYVTTQITLGVLLLIYVIIYVVIVGV